MSSHSFSLRISCNSFSTETLNSFSNLLFSWCFSLKNGFAKYYIFLVSQILIGCLTNKNR